MQVSAIAFDLPVVVDALPPAERLQGGVAFVAGNMFTGLPIRDDYSCRSTHRAIVTACSFSGRDVA